MSSGPVKYWYHRIYWYILEESDIPLGIYLYCYLQQGTPLVPRLIKTLWSNKTALSNNNRHRQTLQWRSACKILTDRRPGYDPWPHWGPGGETVPGDADGEGIHLKTEIAHKTPSLQYILTVLYTLQLEQIRPLGIDVWSFSLEHLVQALGLERAASHCKVDKGHPRAKIGRKFNLRVKRPLKSVYQTLMLTYGWISCGEEDGEWWREINVLVSKGDEDTPTSATNLTIQDRVQNGVIALNILKWERKSICMHVCIFIMSKWTRVRCKDTHMCIWSILSYCMLHYTLVLTWTRSGLPNRRALSRFLRKASSRKLYYANINLVI